MKSAGGSVRRVRQIALIGLDGAGKTSALASLALRRLAHPQGLSARWVQSSAQDAGNSAAPTKTSASRTETHGASGFERAVKRMTEGSFPGRTAAEDADVDLCFEFSVPGDAAQNQAGISFLASVFDYPGNLLISPQSNESAAEVLGRKLAAADAFILFLVAPAGGNSSRRRQSFGLDALFARIEKEVAGKPVAILLTQWDQIGGARPRFGAAKMSARPVLDTEKEAYDWLSTAAGSELAAFIARIEQIAGPSNTQVFASSNVGVLNLQQDIFRAGSERLYRVWIAREEPSDGDGSAPEPDRILYDHKGHTFEVLELDLERRTAKYRDDAGQTRDFALPGELQDTGVERRIELLAGDGNPTVAAYGLEDAFAWLWRRSDERAVALIAQQSAKVGPFSVSALFTGADAGCPPGNRAQEAGSGGTCATRMGSLLAGARGLADDTTVRMAVRNKAASLAARLRRLRSMQALSAAFGTMALLLVAALALEAAVDSAWTWRVKDRLARADVPVETVMRDLADVRHYLGSSLRHTVSRHVLWPVKDAQAAHDRSLSSLDRRLFDAIAMAARADPRSFLDPANRAALARLIDAYLDIVGGTAAQARVQDIRRRLLDLDQDVSLVKVDFRPATVRARGAANASAYHFVLSSGAQVIGEYFQANWAATPPAQPAAIAPVSVEPRQKTINAVLLNKAQFSLCYSETLSPGSTPSNPVCTPATGEWIQIVRDGRITVGPAGPIIATITVNWTPIVPIIPGIEGRGRHLFPRADLEAVPVLLGLCRSRACIRTKSRVELPERTCALAWRRECRSFASPAFEAI